MIWIHGIEICNASFENRNSHHPSIKLEATISDRQINLLDTTIFKNSSDHLLDKQPFHPKQNIFWHYQITGNQIS